MRRSPMQRTRFPRKRPDAAKAKAWRAVKVALRQRAEGHCEVPWCNDPAQDPHHVKKRSQGGSNAISNLVALCRRHHDATDYAVGRGRLYVMPWRPRRGQYGFRFFYIDDYAPTIGPFKEET